MCWRLSKNSLPVACMLLIVLKAVIPASAQAQATNIWENLKLYGGQIHAIAIDPADSSHMYASTWGGDGLFQSFDAGTSWSAVPSASDPWFKNIAVFDIALAPQSPGVLWVANADYIDVSRDAGASWQSMDFASLEGRFCYSVAVDPHDPSGDTVYVGTGGPQYCDEGGSVFKTTDGGTTWQKTGLDSSFNVYDLKISPHAPGLIWVVCNTYQISPQAEICMTSDGGRTWTVWDFDCYMDEIIIHPDDDAVILAAGDRGILHLSDNVWEQLEPSGPCTSLCIPSRDSDVIYASLTDSIAKSTDSGATWSYQPSPGSFLCLTCDPFETDVLWGGHHYSGIFRSADGAHSWQAASAGIAANAIFSFAVSPFDKKTILAGTLAGVFLSTDNAHWRLLKAEPSEAVAFHPTESAVLFAGLDWAVAKSTDGGLSWSRSALENEEEAYGISSLSISPAAPEAVFVSVFFYSGEKGYVLKSSDSGRTYNVSLETSVPVNSVVVHPDCPHIVYAASGSFHPPVAPGSIYKSMDAGTTWQNTTLDAAVINCIAVADADPDLVYAACGAYDYSGAGLYASTNGGISWEPKHGGLAARTEPAAATHLPLFAAAAVQFDKSDSSILYASLYDNGIHMSVDAGEYWTCIGLKDHISYSLNLRTESSGLLSQKTPLLPQATVIAGTASGLYQFNASQTGCLSGKIISSDSGAAVDAALISSACGSQCLSSDGYYLLMLPPGTHTINVRADGFLPASFYTIAVRAGGAATLDMRLTPDPDNQTCPLTFLLAGENDRKELHMLRQLRDDILTRSCMGHLLIRFYYRAGPILCTILSAALNVW